MKKIGIMGGTFNPIHIGHLMLAQWAMDAQSLNEVWFIPTGCSYMKDGKDILAPIERYTMTELAIMDNPQMRCLDVEIKREGYTYTYETLEELHRQYPQHQFYFITGADCLFTIEKWKYPERIFAVSSMIAAVRGDATMDEMESKRKELQTKYQADIILLPFLKLEISSTLVRERIHEHQSIRYFVPEKVISYIEEKGFYGYESK